MEDKNISEPPTEAPQTEEEIMRPVDFKTGCLGMRSDIELLKAKVKNWTQHPVFGSLPQAITYHLLKGKNAPETADLGEMMANLILAYRHLEDARMRLGKAIQAHDGGKSCYPE